MFYLANVSTLMEVSLNTCMLDLCCYWVNDIQDLWTCLCAQCTKLTSHPRIFRSICFSWMDFTLFSFQKMHEVDCRVFLLKLAVITLSPCFCEVFLVVSICVGAFLALEGKRVLFTLEDELPLSIVVWWPYFSSVFRVISLVVLSLFVESHVVFHAFSCIFIFSWVFVLFW